MPILFDPHPTFTAPVKLSVPGRQPASLILEFRHLGQDEIEALGAAALSPEGVKRFTAAIAAAPEPIDSETLVGVMALADLHCRAENHADAVARMVVGWPDGPIDADGNPVPFSPEALRTLLRRYPASGKEITKQYLRALTESSLKN